MQDGARRWLADSWTRRLLDDARVQIASESAILRAAGYDARGTVLQNAGLHRDALPDFEAALRQDSSAASARYHLAVAQYLLGRDALAVGLLRGLDAAAPARLRPNQSRRAVLLRDGLR